MNTLESKKGRLYQKGVVLTPIQIKEIKLLYQKSNDAQEISRILKLDLRTVKKYKDETHYNIGGNFKDNNEIDNYMKEALKENATLYLKELQSKLVDDLNLNLHISTICKRLS